MSPNSAASSIDGRQLVVDAQPHDVEPQIGRPAADRFQLAARHDAESLARLAPQPHAHAVADVKLHDLLAVVEDVNAAVGHHAIDVAENQLDLGADS